VTHADLVHRAATWLRNTMHCGVVLTERQSVGYTLETPDAIGWKAGVSHLVECKISRADFFADRKKCHRRNPEIAMGHYRYYMAPGGLIRVDEVPPGFGLIEVAMGRRARLSVKSSGFNDWNTRREMNLLISELRRYQLHGITYPPLPKGPDAAKAQRRPRTPLQDPHDLQGEAGTQGDLQSLLEGMAPAPISASAHEEDARHGDTSPS
jgi:hypothetical protein